MTKPLHPIAPVAPREVNKYKVPYRYVEVIWDDASSNSESWVSVKDIADPEQVITRGWLVKDTANHICVAASISNEELEDDVVGNTLTIPRGMVLRIRELSVREVKPKKVKSSEA